VLGTVLMDMYARLGLLGRARQVFEELPVRDVVSWSVLIRGLARHGHAVEALECFHRMRDEGVSPDAVTFVCILKACSGSSDFIDMGEELHGEIRKLGLLKKKKHGNGILATALVDMYAKSGSPRKARQVFDDELPVRDVVAWSVMMAGYVEHGCAHDAMECFRCMQEEGILPDAFSFSCILQACSKTGCIAMGTRIHAAVRSIGLVKKNTVLGTTLVDMYAKCGRLGSAKEAFDELPERDVVNWSALMNAYLQHGLTEEVLHCFQEMRSEGILPNVVTFACALKACGGRGSLGAGEEIHGEVSCRGLLDSEAMLGIALVDMYAKCARIMEARQVFEKLPICDVAAWNVLLAGHTQLGHGTDAMMLFDRMLSQDILPDAITFVTLLAALSHAGLLEEGREVFSGMASIYHIVPSLEHYTCMVDLFSRAGQLHASAMLIECMRSSNDRRSLLLALLSACQRWRHADELAKWAFEQCLQLDGTCASAYVFMGNIYTGLGVHGANVR
jgi:pentatricopeptide repeat protein